MLFRLLLTAHSIVRWLVILSAIYVLARAYLGWVGKRTWGKPDRQAGLIFTITYDVQFLIGLILTVMSPLVEVAIANLRNAMKTPELRFIVLAHIPMMVVSLILVHFVSARVKKLEETVARHRWAALGYSLAVLLTLLGIPWSRPLLRGVF